MKSVLVILLALIIGAKCYAQKTATEWFALGYDQDESGNYQAAIISYTRAIQLDPSYTDAYYNRGIAKKALGQFEAAIEDYTKTIQLDPSYESAYINRGNAKYNLGQFEAAVTDHTRAIQLNPSLPNAYINRGIAKNALGQSEAAIADYTTAIQLNPSDATTYHNKGNAEHKLNRFKDAIADFTKAIQLDPLDGDSYNNRGLAYNQIGQREKALSDYTKVIQLAPNDAIAYFNRGVTNAALNQDEAAIEDYTKAIQLDPTDPDSYFNRAFTKSKIKQYQNAVDDYSKVIDLDPTNAGAYNNRGYNYEELGKLSNARDDYERAVKIDPSDALAQNNSERIRKLLGGTKITTIKPRVWVVSIGIATYQRDYILTGLGSPERSAYEVARYFERRGFTDNHEIPVLSGPNANKDAILALLKQEFLNTEVQPDDMVIFYFSGHGVMVDNKIGICPYDYYDASTIITDRDILDIIEQSAARHKVCFIESCKSEVKAMSMLSPESKQKFHQQRNQLSGGLIYITSTMPGEKSIEDPKMGGIFSYYLLNGLRGAANRNNDNLISTKELFDYIKGGVIQKTNGYQVPQINTVGYNLDIPLMVLD